VAAVVAAAAEEVSGTAGTRNFRSDSAAVRRSRVGTTALQRGREPALAAAALPQAPSRPHQQPASCTETEHRMSDARTQDRFINNSICRENYQNVIGA
jgi:hypothetical protein